MIINFQIIIQENYVYITYICSIIIVYCYILQGKEYDKKHGTYLAALYRNILALY